MKMKKKITISLIILAVIVAGIAIYFAQKPKEPETIKIGAILPLTGELSFFGEGDRNALLIFQEQNPDVKLIFEDSKGTPKDGLNAANKLVAQGIKYYITSLSYIVNTIQPVFNKYRYLNLTLNMDPRSEMESKYCMRLYVTFYDEMDKLIELANKLKVKRVAVLYVNVESMHNAVENYLRKRLSEMDVELYSETYDIGTRDFKDLLLKLDKYKPQILRILDFGDKLNIILKQIYEGKLFLNSILLSGVETLLSDYKQFPSAITKKFFFTIPDLLIDEKNPFVQLYSKKYGKSPSYDAVFAYDIAQLLVPFIRKYGYNNVDKVIQEIIRMKEFVGAAAKYQINEYGGISPTISWAKIEDGNIIKINP
jgi:branched-chain amino acid transport system substrate-binding protein